jgi:lantibiotic modifying enzyme
LVRNRNKLLEAADEIGEYICSKSFWSGNRCNWVGRVASTESYDKAACGALDVSLYSGTCGVALFLGQLFECTGNELYRKTAEGSIRHSLSRLDSIEAEIQFSLFRGLTGVAYVTHKLANILDDKGFANQALEIVSKLKDLSALYYLTDMISGIAGAIPVLLYFHRNYEDKRSLDVANFFGRRLISSAVKEKVGWSWTYRTDNLGHNPNNKNLTGFSHGAAGIGWSLSELYDTTHQEEFGAGAEQAFAYEDRWFSPTHKNWPDFRSTQAWMVGQNNELSYATAWCHGAPGICLSRLRAYQILGHNQYLKDARAAISTTVKIIENKISVIERDYSLCHGIAGLSEIMLIGSKLLRDDSLRTAANKATFYCIDRYAGSDFKEWPCGLPGSTPNLMLGLAGIGHHLLRLYEPNRVSPILLLTE